MTTAEEFRINNLKDEVIIKSEIIYQLRRQIKIKDIKIGKLVEEVQRLKPYAEIVPK